MRPVRPRHLPCSHHGRGRRRSSLPRRRVSRPRPGGNIAIGQGALAGLNVNNNTIRINNVVLPTGATSTSGITGSLISVGANGTVRVGGGLN